MIQSKIEVARAVRRARQLARQDLPEAWLPIVLDALAQLGRQGVRVDRATVEHGCLRIVMPTTDERARAIEARAAHACALIAGMDEMRFVVWTNCRRLGPRAVGRALALEKRALEAIRDSQARRPSRALAAVLDAAYAALPVDPVGLARQRQE